MYLHRKLLTTFSYKPIMYILLVLYFKKQKISLGFSKRLQCAFKLLHLSNEKGTNATVY